MDGVLVEAQPLPNILKQLDDNPAGNVFDAVVFSNVFTGNAVIWLFIYLIHIEDSLFRQISSDLEKIAEVMPSVLRLMTPGGVIIIRENLGWFFLYIYYLLFQGNNKFV
jgi:transcription elongation factor GreA-like protein